MPCCASKFSRLCAVPANHENIEKEWLSAALDAEVASFETRVCSEGQVAITVVLHDIVYASPEMAEQRPSSLAIKIHPASAESREFGKESKMFSTEIWVYSGEFKTLLADAGVETPETYGIWTDGGTPGRDKIEFFALMMEDLTLRYDPYSVEKSPDAGDVENIALKSMLPLHAAFWNKVDLQNYPALDPGPSLLEDFFPMMEGFGAAWPGVKARWPSKANFTGPLLPSGFPKTWKRGLELLDQLARPGEAKRLYRKCAKIWRSRVKTCVHGDFNTGNVWRSKTDPSHHAVADWQVTREGPCGQDWVTFIGTVDPDLVSAADFREIIGKYHDALSTATQGAVAKDYPIEQLLDDIALINPCYWMVYMFVFSAALDAGEAGDMPQEKFEYTCASFWPKIMESSFNWMNFDSASAYQVVEAVQAGTYDRYGTVVQEGVPPVANRHGDTPAKAQKRADLERGLPAGWCVVVTSDGQGMYCPARNMKPGNEVWEMQRKRPTAPTR